MINDDAVRNWDFGPIVQRYTQRDTMLYALGIGMGADPMDEGELRFVFEKQLQAVPLLLIGNDGEIRKPLRSFFFDDRHAQMVVRLTGNASIEEEGKGAIAVIERELRDEQTGEVLAKGRNVSFLRGDGGFSAKGGRSDPGPEPLPGVPDRAADIEVSLPTLDRQALIYRLSGDYNVLHADPAVAQAAGFAFGLGNLFGDAQSDCRPTHSKQRVAYNSSSLSGAES